MYNFREWGGFPLMTKAGSEQIPPSEAWDYQNHYQVIKVENFINKPLFYPAISQPE